MRGSYQVIKTFTELIKRNQLEDKVQLRASFCMGRCMSGISLLVNDSPVENVGFANAEQVFYTEVYPLAVPGAQEAPPPDTNRKEGGMPL